MSLSSQLPHSASLFQDDSAIDCPVCSTSFDDTLRRPRSLPCGHSLCNPCINRLEEQGNVTCPICRHRHAVPEAGSFPINHALEAVLSSRREPGQNEAADLSSTIRSLLQEQKTKVQAAIRTCQKVQQELDQYQATLTDWGDHHHNLENTLKALTDQTRRAKVLIRQEESPKVADKKEQVQQREQQLYGMLQALSTVVIELEAGVVVVDAARSTEEAEQSVQECREMFPNVDTITTTRRVSVPPSLYNNRIREHTHLVPELSQHELATIGAMWPHPALYRHTAMQNCFQM